MLTKLRTATIPTHCIWYDAETSPERVSDVEERHLLSFGWACYRRQLSPGRWSRHQWYRFEHAADLWDWVESKIPKKTKLHMYAHNAAYDATVCDTWRELPQRGWSMRAAVIDSPPFIVHWSRGGSTLRMLDTLNIWKMSLAKLGDHVGLPKGELPPKWTGSRADDQYCRRDVEIIIETCIRWWRWLADNDYGSAASTLASQALTTFRHRFLSHSILLDDNMGALQLARAAYHGGRVEVFALGEHRGPLYLLDVRSEYPAVMRTEEYPTILRGVYGGVGSIELADMLARYAVVADVTVDTAEPVYPFSDSSPLLFPTGRFRTALSSGELSFAIAHDHIVHVHRCAVYDRAPIFRDFITTLFAERVVALRDGDLFTSLTLRLLLNSLYGKFGQRGRHSKRVATTADLTVKVWDEIDGETGERYRMRQLAGVIEQQWTEGESATSHPAIAAHVTGYGRIMLWSLISTAGRGHVLYCDTDSVLVTQVGYDRLRPLIHGDDLGSLHLDRVVGTAVLHAPKDYKLDDKWRTKGVRQNAVWLDANTVRQDKWLGLRSLIMRGDVSAPVVRREVKHLTRRYDKGVVLPSGNVRPYRLPTEHGLWLG